MKTTSLSSLEWWYHRVCWCGKNDGVSPLVSLSLSLSLQSSEE